MDQDEYINNSQMNKIAQRLKLDPAYQQIVKKAQSDPENTESYVYEIIRTFKLDKDWINPITWLITGVYEHLPHSGSMYEYEKDPVSGATRYTIPVKPETTLQDVKDSYKEIKRLYDLESENKLIRSDDTEKTEIQLYAYRRDEEGASAKTIRSEIDKKFNQDLELFEISNLIKEGENKKLG